MEVERQLSTDENLVQDSGFFVSKLSCETGAVVLADVRTVGNFLCVIFKIATVPFSKTKFARESERDFGLPSHSVVLTGVLVSDG